MDFKEFNVLEGDEGARVDKYLASRIEGFSRESLKDIFSGNKILVNSEPAKPSYKVKVGDTVTIELPGEAQLDIVPENLPIKIVYEDDHVVVIDKAQGMSVHPAPGVVKGTLVNALLYHVKDLSTINGVTRPGIVHRIDKDTTGLLVVAKTNFAHNHLAYQFANHSVQRAYSAIVHGNFTKKRAVINMPIGRDPLNRKRMAVTEKNNKNAITNFHVVQQFDGYSMLRLELRTGRTHQIRVHMSHIGHPVVGDKLYGRRSDLDDRFAGQLLHAYHLGFIHPFHGRLIEFDSPLPEGFLELTAKQEE
ncbi:MAG: RluA family pseudouridine synthase [Eubacteriaceae bacterium]|nr:RluA family pseudouridine synthase [Eubacteriaceae bacterium]